VGIWNAGDMLCRSNSYVSRIEINGTHIKEIVNKGTSPVDVDIRLELGISS
jgi:hypothetical protein